MLNKLIKTQNKHLQNKIMLGVGITIIFDNFLDDIEITKIIFLVSIYNLIFIFNQETCWVK